MVTKTINIPVTAKYDGCFCSEECEHWCNGCYIDLLKDTPLLGHPETDLLDGTTMILPVEQGEGYIRTRWCCETFGMCEQVKEQEQRDTTMDGVELETIDANDAETLRRWTSE